MGWTHRQGNNKIFVAVHDVRSFWFLPEMFDVDVAYLSSPIIYRRKVNLESDPLTLINKTGAPFPRSSPSSIKTTYERVRAGMKIKSWTFVLKVSCSTAFVCRTLCLLATHFAMHWAIFTGHCQMSGVYFLPWTYNLRSLRRLKSQWWIKLRTIFLRGIEIVLVWKVQSWWGSSARVTLRFSHTCVMVNAVINILHGALLFKNINY